MNENPAYLDYYVENSEAVFIDLRSRQEYEKMHIKDAVNIPFEEMERQLQNNYSNRNAGFYDNSNDRSRAGDIATCYSDASLAEKELGWKAENGIKEMCEDSWRWQKNKPNGYEE